MTREEAIEEFQNVKDIIRQDGKDWFDERDLEIIDMAIEALSAEAEWIPCSERLPDIKEHHVSEACLVYFENGAYGFAELEENIFGQVGWNCEREDEYHELLGEVIAWMPLPKPYKGNGLLENIAQTNLIITDG